MTTPDALRTSAPVPRSRKPETSRHDGPSENWTKMPNDLTALFAGGKLGSLTQCAIIWIIQTRTWGDARRPEWARLSIRELARLCGPSMDKNTVAAAANDLCRRGLIAIQDGGACTAAKLYKVTYENWKDAPPYEIAKAALVEEENPATDEETSSPQLEQQPRPRRCGAKITVKPGKKPETVPLRLQLERIEYACEGSAPVGISTQASEDGVLFVTVFAEESLKPEANKRRSTVQLELPSGSKPTKQNQQLTKFDSEIALLLKTEFGKGFDPADPGDRKFAAAIVAAAGDCTPTEYREYAQAEIRKMHRARKAVVSGILKDLAAQAAKAHAAAPTSPAPAATDPNAEREAERAWQAQMERLRVEDPEAWELINRQSGGRR